MGLSHCTFLVVVCQKYTRPCASLAVAHPLGSSGAAGAAAAALAAAAIPRALPCVAYGTVGGTTWVASAGLSSIALRRSCKGLSCQSLPYRYTHLAI